MGVGVIINFKQRIVPGVYQFDVVICNLPHAGAVIGSIICSPEKFALFVPKEFENKKEELSRMSFEAFQNLKEMFGD